MITPSDIFFCISVFLYFFAVLFNINIDEGFGILNENKYFKDRDKKIDIFFAILSISMLIPIIYSKDSVLHTYIYIKFIGTLFFFLYLPESIIKKREITNILLFSFLLQGAIGVYQLIFQKSAGLHFLGEPYLSKDGIGIAKIDLSSGEKIIRPYGTLQHPNILGISCVIIYFLSLYSSFAPLRYFLIIPIIISFSRTAWLIFGVILLINLIYKNKKVVKKILIFSIIPILTVSPLIISRLNIFDSSFYNRVELYIYSLKMLIYKPFGVGLGNFTLNMQNYSDKLLETWKFQPVHNFFLLLTNETGIISIGIFLYLVYIIFKKSDQNLFIKSIILSIIIIVGSFDHFFLTSYIGITLMFFLFRFI